MEVKFLKERGKSGVGTLHYNGSDQHNLEWGNGEKWLKKCESINGSFCILLHSYLVAICCPKRHIQERTICINKQANKGWSHQSSLLET